jgi:hypothetical protein
VYLTYVKKSLTIFFTALYVITVVGVTVAVHFCGETVTSVQVIQFASGEKSCGCEETDVPDDCCKDEIKTVQINDDQVSVQIDQPSSPQTDMNTWADASSEALYSSHMYQTVLPADSPPGSPPLYILNSVFLI